MAEGNMFIRKLRPVVILADDSEKPNLLCREESFTMWQYGDDISATSLASAGFYQESNGSRISCIECGFNVGVTSLINIFNRHRQSYPHCSFAAKTNKVVNSSNEEIAVNHANGKTHNDTVAEVDSRQHFGTNNYEHSSNHLWSALGAVSYDASSDYSRTLGNSNHLQNNSDIDNRHNSIPGSDGSRNQPTEEPEPTPTHTRLSSKYRDLNVRESSFCYWNSSNRYQDMSKLVESGFYYSGNGDAVRCFSCYLSLEDWKPHYDPWEEHARHSPSCPYLISKTGQEFIDGVQGARGRIPTPRYLQYVDKEHRMMSFENPRWPADNVRQTPEGFADAGFFFTGERDAVRCHFCGGGLRDWEPEDDPWFEHGRWFPFCRYVIEKRGIQFIENCATGNVNTPRYRQYVDKAERAMSFEYLGWPADNIRQTPEELADSGFFYTGQGDGMVFSENCDTVHRNYLNSVFLRTETSDTSEEKRRKKKLENPLFTAAAMSVRNLGYSKEDVEKAILIYKARKGIRIFTAEDLLKMIFELEEKGVVIPPISMNDVNNGQPNKTRKLDESEEKWRQKDLENPLFSAAAMSVKEMGYLDKTVEEAINKHNSETGNRNVTATDLMKIIMERDEELLKENEMMKYNLTCVNCEVEERNNVFLPCGHLLMCEPCARKQTKCCQCDSSVRETKKVFY